MEKKNLNFELINGLEFDVFSTHTHYSDFPKIQNEIKNCLFGVVDK